MRIITASLLLLGFLPQDPPQPPASGRFRGEIVDPATKEVIMKVRMQIPEKPAEGKRWGFLFVCHGFRGHENNSYLDGAVQALKRLGLADQYLVIAGKSKGDGWTAEDDDRFLRLYSWAKDRYPLDPQRIYLFGSSNGAAFVCRFGLAHPDLVRGVVSYCGGYNFSKMEAAPAGAKRPDWYFVHGGNDRPENSRRACDELGKRGQRYVFRKLDGYGHTDIWDGKGHPDMSLVDGVRDDWAAWMHALSEAKKSDDLKGLERSANWRWDGAQAALCERARTGDAEAAAALGRVARLMLPGNFEDKAVIWTLVRLLDHADLKVREAAFAGLKPAAEDGFGFAPGLADAERSAATTKWVAWCEGKCGPEPAR